MMIKMLAPAFLIFFFTTVLSGCRIGGKITSEPGELIASNAGSISPLVAQPTLTSPVSTPFYSAAGTLSIEGLCMKGDTVTISGDLNATTICDSNSSYDFTIVKNVDGIYSFQIIQSDGDGNSSIAFPLIWIKKSSITPPTITSPATKPFLSSGESLTISGSCETGSNISLTGDGAGSTTCVNSSYTINLPKAADGDYAINVVATDLAGNSGQASMIWKKHALMVSPTSPTLDVNTSQVITITGGSGSYVLSLKENNSSGSLNTSTKTYTTGTIAYVTDIVNVTDSLGVSVDIPIQTMPSAPDHLVIQDGNTQIENIGSTLPLNFKVKLVDRYNNAISSFPLIFSKMSGDAVLLSSDIQVTNAQGLASVQVKEGHSSLKSYFRVSALSSTLPDLANSGGSSVTLYTTTKTLNNSFIGSSYLTGQNPASMVMGTFVTGGFGDMIVTNASSNTIGIFIGLGNGIFEKMKTFSLGGCSGADRMVSADFNEDGNLDAAVICNSSSQIAVFSGTGDGNFSRINFSTITSPSGLAVGDLNGDLHLDLVTASPGTNEISIHLGAGNGTFASHVEYGVGSSPLYVAIDDLNNDSKKDIVVANSATGNVGILFQITAGTFGNYSEAFSGNGLNFVTTSDIDQDGKIDILSTNSLDQSFTVFWGDGLGNLTTSSSFAAGTNPNFALLTDLNQDNQKDILISNYDDNTLSVLQGLGSRSFTAGSVEPVENSPTSLVAYDANNDGRKDVFLVSVANNHIQQFSVNPTGGLGYFASTESMPVASVAEDLNNDGKKDIVVANQNTNNISVFEGLGNGHVKLKSTLTVANQPSAIASADFNKDGFYDLVVVNKSGNSVSVFLGKGDFTFETRADYSVGIMPTGVVVGDFNRDGKLDLATSNMGTSKVSILTGVGNGTFNIKVDYLTGGSPYGIAAGDFDGDGLLDLATVNNSDATVSILLANTDGSFKTSVDYQVGGLPTGIVTGYFNNDHLLDIATSNFGDGTVSILLGSGSGAFGSQLAFAVANTPTSIATGDLNNKGRSDLFVALGTENAFASLQGMGAGQFNNPIMYQESGNISSIISTDMNNDAKIDVVILNTSTEKVKVYLGQ